MKFFSFNSRFIKLFPHSEKGSVKERLGGSNGSVVVHGEKLTKTVVNEAFEDPEMVKEKKAKEALAIQKNQEMLQIKHDLLKQAEEKKKAARAQVENILKSKHVSIPEILYCFILLLIQELLDGLIEQQKALILKLEKGKGTIKADEKAKIMKLLNELLASIDRTKEDIQNTLSVSGLKNRTRKEVRFDRVYTNKCKQICR